MVDTYMVMLTEVDVYTPSTSDPEDP